MKSAIRFLRVSFLWVLLLPYPARFLGAASNQLVLIANHDKFPVLINARQLRALEKAAVAQSLLPDEPPPDFGDGMIDKIHCVMTKDTHLNFLADVFDFHDETDSIGDLLIDASGWLSQFSFFVWAALVVQKLTKKKEQV